MSQLQSLACYVPKKHPLHPQPSAKKRQETGGRDSLGLPFSPDQIDVSPVPVLDHKQFLKEQNVSVEECRPREDAEREVSYVNS